MSSRKNIKEIILGYIDHSIYGKCYICVESNETTSIPHIHIKTISDKLYVSNICIFSNTYYGSGRKSDRNKSLKLSIYEICEFDRIMRSKFESTNNTVWEFACISWKQLGNNLENFIEDAQYPNYKKLFKRRNQSPG